MAYISSLVKRGKDIIQTRGFLAFLKSIFRFISALTAIHYRSYYIYEKILKKPNQINRGGFSYSNIDNFELKIIDSEQQMDELINQKYIFDNYPYLEDERKWLNQGMLLFCIFINKDFAHRSWIALNSNSRLLIENVSYDINYDNREISIGYTQTIPKYRDQGIYTEAYFRIYEFLGNQGFKKAKFIVEKNNLIPQKVQAKLGSVIIGDAYYYKIGPFKIRRITYRR